MASLPVLSMEKARLVVAAGYNPDRKELEFKYNPEQFSLSRSADWSDQASHPGQKAGARPTHQRTNPTTVTMEIFFDAFGELLGDVTDDVQTLLDWTRPCPPAKNGVMSPPLLEFHWGSSNAAQGIQGYLQTVSANYTLFRRDGTPIRATCNLTLIEVPQPETKTNPTSGSRAGFQAHLVIEGETLHSVAWAEYQRPDFWRAIAAFNEIDDPLRVPAGTRLLLPPYRDAAKLA
ncbi:MAG TPA: hypothetical protein VKR30_02740 [Candidatus Limnocylindrales bacterium]|nr:hypothetical protein [Candidatus Limnocylindrales bacterium]